MTGRRLASDLPLPVNCPVCTAPLHYVVTFQRALRRDDGAVSAWEDAQIYRCYRHGRFWMSKSEGLKPEPM